MRDAWRGGEPEVKLRPGTPFFSWGEEIVHLAEAPIATSDQIFIPLQFIIDILPWKLPESFDYDPDTRTLEVLAQGVPARHPVHDPGASWSSIRDTGVAIREPGAGREQERRTGTELWPGPGSDPGKRSRGSRSISLGTRIF